MLSGIYEFLRPIIMARAGAIPEIGGMRFALSYPEKEDCGVFFTISDKTGTDDYVASYLCWDAKYSACMWLRMQTFYGAVRPALSRAGIPSEDAPVHAPRTPWLAVILLPEMFTLSEDDLWLLGDIERCFAWSIILHEESR